MPETTQFRNAALIYNPKAGRSRSKRERQIGRACELLEAHGIHCELVPTTGPGSATDLARNEAAAGRDLIIVCGGDGTVNEVVNGMAGSRVPLALLPAGTGNVLAKELGLPWNIQKAAEYIPPGEVRRIALGRAGERYFICMAGIGADAAIVRSLNAQAKSNLGILSFWLEGFHQLFTYDFRHFKVEIEGKEHLASELIVSRTKNYGGPVRLTRRASLFRDEFEVFLTGTRSRPLYLIYFLAQQVGLLERFSSVNFQLTRKVTVTKLHGPAYLQLDGELAGELPVTIELVPDALSLVVPKGMTD